MKHQVFFSLFFVLMVSTVFWEEDAHADLFKAWAQIQAGYTDGQGAEAMDGDGMVHMGFSGGIQLLFIGAFVDIRLEDLTDLGATETEDMKGGTWNQAGLYTSFDIGIDPIEIELALRAAYVYVKFTKAAEEAYIKSGKTDAPPNKGLNFSAVGSVGYNIAGPIYMGFMVDGGYHLLLPSSMGVNYHGLGYLKFKF